MKKGDLLVLFLICFLFISCDSEEHKYEELFTENYKDLSSIQNYIEHKINSMKNDSNKNVILFVTKPQYGPRNNFIYDKYLSLKMHELNIKQIRCVTTQSGMCGLFDNVQFQLNSSDYPPDQVVYFVFNKCSDLKNFKSNTIFQKKLNKKWGLLIDRS